MLLGFFILVASVISVIDYHKRLIPDKIIIPAILLMALFKWGNNTFTTSDLIAVAIVVFIFIIPILFGMVFGGGDIRFGAFCALFLGLEQVGVFIALSGIVHLVILALLQKKSFAFAPAMSLAALGAYVLGRV